MSKITEAEAVAMSEKEPLMAESRRLEGTVVDSCEPSYSSFPDPRVQASKSQVGGPQACTVSISNYLSTRFNGYLVSIEFTLSI